MTKKTEFIVFLNDSPKRICRSSADAEEVLGKLRDLDFKENQWKYETFEFYCNCCSWHIKEVEVYATNPPHSEFQVLGRALRPSSGEIEVSVYEAQSPVQQVLKLLQKAQSALRTTNLVKSIKDYGALNTVTVEVYSYNPLPYGELFPLEAKRNNMFCFTSEEAPYLNGTYLWADETWKLVVGEDFIPQRGIMSLLKQAEDQIRELGCL